MDEGSPHRLISGVDMKKSITAVIMESSVFASRAVVGVGVRASQLLPPRLKLSAAPFDFRFKKNVIDLKLRERWQAVSASKSDLPDGASVKDNSGGVKSGDAPQGPPFLTILAGFLVLFLVFWIIGSILTWLISFSVASPPQT